MALIKSDRPHKKGNWKKWLIAAAAITLCAALILGGLSLYGSYQLGKIPALSADGLTSNVEDMLAYARLMLDASGYLKDCQRSMKEINASSQQYAMMGIHMDEIGLAWIRDRENDIIWHNGGTGNYNSYLGFCPARRWWFCPTLPLVTGSRPPYWASNCWVN